MALTLEEQERRAYASGDPIAPLLALAVDGDEVLNELERVKSLLADAVRLMSDDNVPRAQSQWLKLNRGQLP